jgi:hypothetical protein
MAKITNDAVQQPLLFDFPAAPTASRHRRNLLSIINQLGGIIWCRILNFSLSIAIDNENQKILHPAGAAVPHWFDLKNRMILAGARRRPPELYPHRI